MAVAVAVLVLLACLGLALLPLLLGGAEDVGAEEADRRSLLRRERQRVLDEIREVDLDLAMGKVTEKDHAALRAGLEDQAMATIAALRELDDGEPAPEAGAGATAPEAGAGGQEPGLTGEETEGRA